MSDRGQELGYTGKKELDLGQELGYGQELDRGQQLGSEPTFHRFGPRCAGRSKASLQTLPGLPDQATFTCKFVVLSGQDVKIDWLVYPALSKLSPYWILVITQSVTVNELSFVFDLTYSQNLLEASTASLYCKPLLNNLPTLAATVLA